MNHLTRWKKLSFENFKVNFCALCALPYGEDNTTDTQNTQRIKELLNFKDFKSHFTDELLVQSFFLASMANNLNIVKTLYESCKAQDISLTAEHLLPSFNGAATLPNFDIMRYLDDQLSIIDYCAGHFNTPKTLDLGLSQIDWTRTENLTAPQFDYFAHKLKADALNYNVFKSNMDKGNDDVFDFLLSRTQNLEPKLLVFVFQCSVVRSKRSVESMLRHTPIRQSIKASSEIQDFIKIKFSNTAGHESYKNYIDHLIETFDAQDTLNSQTPRGENKIGVKFKI